MKQQILTLLVIVYFFCFCSGCAPEYRKLNSSGYRKVQAKDYEGAFKDFDASIKSNNTYWLAYLNRGASYAREGNCKKAVDDFYTSISLHPKNPLAFDNLGLCKMELGDSIGACSAFTQAVKLDKNFDIAFTHLGMLLARMDSCLSAVYYLEVALQKKAFDQCHDEKEVLRLRKKCSQ